ncbi:hypothetical protein N665_0162s0030 [Sinapis alba]|nr:hypothetical protein N665_0162s0030 [Sinapis alba]
MHELWFVFARRPLRFSLQEFHAVTRFECNTSISLKEFDDWKDDGGFWSKVLSRKDGSITLFNLWTKHMQSVKKWRNADRIRLVYLAIILCVVLARDEKANIPLKYITVVMDLEKVRKYPWGVAAYDLLCNSIAKNRDKLKDKTTSYVLDGFSYALQIWAMEAVPKIGKLCGKKLDKGFKEGPRCINWMGAAKVSYEEIIRLENIFTPEDDIYPYISCRGNMVVIQNQDFFRDDDVEDDRIKVLMELIRTKHDFSEHIWEFEESPEVSLDLDDEAAESDEDFQTPKGSKNLGDTSKKGTKRLPDRGMEKRKLKVLSSLPKQAPFTEEMKAFMTQLFEQNFHGMEQRLDKHMAETFENMKSELKDLRKNGSVEVENGEPSPTKPSTPKPSTSQPSASQPSTSQPSASQPSTSQPSLRRSKRGKASTSPVDVNFSQADDIFREMGTQGVEGLSQASYVPDFDPSQTNKEDDWWTPMTSVRGSKNKQTKGNTEASTSPVDVNFSQADDIFREMGTQGVEGLSQASYVPDFDPSQTNKEDDWWTPMTSVRGSKNKQTKGNTTPSPSQWEKWSKGKGKKLQLSDTPFPQDGSPQSSLYYFSEESWIGFTAWSMNPIPLPIGPTCLNLSVSTRIVCPGKWLGNEEMDAFMYIWRVNTTLKRWAPTRIAFMNAMFCLQMDAAYKMFSVNRKAYQLPDFLLSYGRGELPSHGRTDEVWGVNVDRLYFPLFVNGNHWISVCVNIIEKRVEVFDCSRGKNRQYVEKFAALILRIVKAVGPPESKKQLLLSPYSIVEVPMQARLNKSCCDCGAYALKHLECHVLGLDLSLVDDEIIQGCRQKIAVDLWEAAHDPILAQVMTRYVPSPWERSEVFDLEEDLLCV